MAHAILQHGGQSGGPGMPGVQLPCLPAVHSQHDASHLHHYYLPLPPGQGQGLFLSGKHLPKHICATMFSIPLFSLFPTRLLGGG